jgi:glutamate 5-kinase
MAMQSGCHGVMMQGAEAHPLRRLQQGARASWFVSATTPLSARKQWIGGQLRTLGTLTLDAGAAKAVQAGASLLPVGVTAVAGAFGRGDCVQLRDANAQEIGCGLIAYTADELRLIQGKRTSDFAALLGYDGRAACIHRDDMVLR